MQPTPVFLPEKSYGQSLVGYSPRGHRESDTTENWALTWAVNDTPTPKHRKRWVQPMYLVQGVLSGVILSPWEHWATSGVFGCHDWGVCFWYLVSRGQGCASASNKEQDSPHPRKDLDPDANSAESGALPWADFSSSSQADLAPGHMEQHFLNSHTLRNQLGAFI